MILVFTPQRALFIALALVHVALWAWVLWWCWNG